MRSSPRNEKKFRTSCSGNTTTNMWPYGFQILKKQTKSRNHEICQDLMISYEEAMVKIEQVSNKSIMYDIYKSKYLRRRIVALSRIRLDLESKWRSNWGLTSKLFVYVIENINWFMRNFGNFLDSFDNFNLLSAIIEF